MIRYRLIFSFVMRSDAVDLDRLDQISESVRLLLENSGAYYEKIGRFVEEYVYHNGTSAQVGAKYLVSQIQKKIEEKKKG